MRYAASVGTLLVALCSLGQSVFEKLASRQTLVKVLAVADTIVGKIHPMEVSSKQMFP